MVRFFEWSLEEVTVYKNSGMNSVQYGHTQVPLKSSCMDICVLFWIQPLWACINFGEMVPKSTY